MTDQQKEIVRELIRLSYDHGFSSTYPLQPIADKMGVTVNDIYDENTETGILWEYGPYGNGFLDFSASGTHAGVWRETCELLENWSR